MWVNVGGVPWSWPSWARATPPARAAAASKPAKTIRMEVSPSRWNTGAVRSSGQNPSQSRMSARVLREGSGWLRQRFGVDPGPRRRLINQHQAGRRREWDKCRGLGGQRGRTTRHVHAAAEAVTLGRDLSGTVGPQHGDRLGNCVVRGGLGRCSRVVRAGARRCRDGSRRRVDVARMGLSHSRHEVSRDQDDRRSQDTHKLLAQVHSY